MNSTCWPLICESRHIGSVVRCYELRAARTFGWAASTSWGWPGPIELLSHRLVELAWFPDDDVVSQFNVGGTGECAGRVHGGPLLGSPSLAHSSSCGVVEPAARLCLCGVGPTSALCRTFAFQLLMPPPLAHLQRPSSPSGSNYPTCHPKPPAPLPW